MVSDDSKAWLLNDSQVPQLLLQCGQVEEVVLLPPFVCHCWLSLQRSSMSSYCESACSNIVLPS